MSAGLLGEGPIALDTSIFIYFIEQHPKWLTVVKPFFVSASAGAMTLVTSSVTLLEVLVVPYRNGDLVTSDRYEQLLTRSKGLRLVEADRSVMRAAAQLRAVHALRTADALQIASAISTGCSAFVTNDTRLPQMRVLRIVNLSDLI